MKPHLRSCARPKKDVEAEAQLQKYGLLGAVETEVMVTVSQLLDEVQKVNDFPDWIIEKGNLDDFRKGREISGPLRFDKNRRIKYFTTYDPENMDICLLSLDSIQFT